MLLTELQLSIAQHPASKIAVLAGPGTGKTTVLTQRLIHLIKNLKVPPDRACALTFSRAARAEMAARCLSQIPEHASRVKICTFHSLAYRILRQHTRCMDVMTSVEKRRLLHEIIREKAPDLSARFVAEQISRAKNNLLKPEDLEDMDPPMPQVAGIWREFEKRKQKLEYDDLLLLACEVLRAEPERRFKAVLVDEFQDISPLQYKLLRRLVGENGTQVFIVGDPCQCIYEWRASRPELFDKFKEDYNAEVLYLNLNFRSRAEIVQLANKVLRHIDPKIPPLEPQLDRGGSIQVLEVPNDTEEAELAAESLKGEDPEETAVLARTREQLELIERIMAAKGIQTSTTRTLVTRTECTLLAELLRTIIDPHTHPQGLFKLARLLDPYLGRAFRHEAELLSQQKQISIYDALKEEFSRPFLTVGARKVREYIETCRKQLLEGRTAAQLLAHLRITLHLDEKLEKHLELKGILQDPDEVEQTLNYLIACASELETPEKFLEWIEESKKKVGINTLTIHKAKGLEFKTVWIAGAADGVFPLNGNLKEEMRLFFVAVTRAKEKLIISHPKFCLGEPRKDCLFLKIIRDEDTRQTISKPLNLLDLLRKILKITR